MLIQKLYPSIWTYQSWKSQNFFDTTQNLNFLVTDHYNRSIAAGKYEWNWSENIFCPQVCLSSGSFFNTHIFQQWIYDVQMLKSWRRKRHTFPCFSSFQTCMQCLSFRTPPPPLSDICPLCEYAAPGRGDTKRWSVRSTVVHEQSLMFANIWSPGPSGAGTLERHQTSHVSTSTWFTFFLERKHKFVALSRLKNCHWCVRLWGCLNFWCYLLFKCWS